MKFFIEQIALCPPDAKAAIKLLEHLGLTEWAHDTVIAKGKVFGNPGINEAALAFNYQAAREEPKPLELEVLHYIVGDNWMAGRGPSVSHLGMHCSLEELEEWRMKFSGLGIKIAQEVDTRSHTNPVIAGKRWYKYVIFDTRNVLGVDLKFIVRKDAP